MHSLLPEITIVLSELIMRLRRIFYVQEAIDADLVIQSIIYSFDKSHTDP